MEGVRLAAAALMLFFQQLQSSYFLPEGLLNIKRKGVKTHIFSCKNVQSYKNVTLFA